MPAAASRPLVVVGDALLDRDLEGAVERLCPDAPVPVVDQSAIVARPGGAGLAAALAAAEGREVTLVTALAPDAAGEELRAVLGRCGVEVVDLGLEGETIEKVRIRAGGRSLLRVDRGAGGRVGTATAAARAAIGWAEALLVSDYGRGVAADPGLRAAVAERAAAGAPVVWDPHPRGAVPVAGVTLVTPNAREAAGFCADGGPSAGDEPRDRAGGAPSLEAAPGGGGLLGAAAHAATLTARWSARWVCVTRGADGAVLCAAGGDGPYAFPARAVSGDPCGAGDRFAARTATALADGADPPGAVGAAVAAASAFVAAGGAGAARLAPEGGLAFPGGTGTTRPTSPTRAELEGEAEVLATQTRAQGGVLVATGGCFDLLHPGHVHTLQAARALGDRLVVCLNGDASVRRLKGPPRPLVGEEDRAAVLRALGCVDAVLIFDEDTPAAALERLRPHVWAKGGDYAARELPEAATLAGWGGQAVILPFVDGRSTTRLIEEVSAGGLV